MIFTGKTGAAEEEVLTETAPDDAVRAFILSIALKSLSASKFELEIFIVFIRNTFVNLVDASVSILRGVPLISRF